MRCRNDTTIKAQAWQPLCRRAAAAHIKRMNSHPEFLAVVRRLEARAPLWIVPSIRYLLEPSARLVRIPAASFFVLGGFAGFLPVLGFWMLPLGLILFAVDMPFLRPPLTRALMWLERKIWGAPAEGAGRE